MVSRRSNLSTLTAAAYFLHHHASVGVSDPFLPTIREELADSVQNDVLMADSSLLDLNPTIFHKGTHNTNKLESRGFSDSVVGRRAPLPPPVQHRGDLGAQAASLD